MRAERRKRWFVAGAGALCALALAALGVALLSGGDNPAPAGETIEIVIPPGTGDALAKGRDPGAIPDRIEGTVGDVVRIDNQDDQLYVISGIPVPAGRVATLPLRRAGTYETACTAHADDAITMQVAPS